MTSVEYRCLPEEGGLFKIVQVLFEERPVLIFGRMGEFHKNMLRAFLEEKGIPIEMVPSRKYPEHKVPSPDGDRYRVVGMGEMSISAAYKRISKPGGGSVDYQIGTDPAFDELLKTSPPEGWKYGWGD
jgi:hypothetical protein